MKKLIDKLRKQANKVVDTVKDLPNSAKDLPKTAGKVIRDLPKYPKAGLRKLEDALIWVAKDREDANKPADPSKPVDPNKTPNGKSSPTRRAVGWGMVVFAMVTPFTAPIGIAGGYILAKDSPEAQKQLAKLRKKYPGPFGGMIKFTGWIMPRIAKDMDQMTDPSKIDKPPVPPANDNPKSADNAADNDAPKADQVGVAHAAKKRLSRFKAFDPRNFIPRGLGGKAGSKGAKPAAEDRPNADRRRRVMLPQTPAPKNTYSNRLSRL